MVSHNGELPRRKLTGVDPGNDGGVLKCYVYVGLASYPSSSTEKRGGSLEDFITCLVT